MAKNNAPSSVSFFLLQLALGLFFLALGLMGLTEHNSTGSKVLQFLGRNDTLKVLAAVGEVVMGAILVLGLFVPVSSSLSRILGLVIFVLWALFIVAESFAKNFLEPSFVPWLYTFAWRAVILVGLWIVGERGVA